MTYTFKLSRRLARLRAPVFAALITALTGCDNTESLAPESTLPTNTVDQIAVADVEVASASFAGGIPFGMSAQPLSEFGSRFNGSKLTIGPDQLLTYLSVIRSRGGRIVLMMAGHERYYREGGRFSFAKWKARIDRFKGKDFSSYINDGTIIGHYMIDEPNDAHNWGNPVPPSMLEEMAKYSKQLWPGMATIVRVDPSYLGSNHRYLDAGWAQYLSRRGNVGDYIRSTTSEAQRKGLGLVVGLNVLRGGIPNGTQMTASEVLTWGSALLSSSYPCAFISWQYNSNYLSATVKGAMDVLRRKAESRSGRSCRGG